MGLPFAPSEANFVMLVLPDEHEAARVFEEMLSQGVVVRPLKAFGLPNCLRISTGTDEDNAFCVDVLRRAHAADTGAHAAD
jgi:histidinol-phosphate aminotransferase